MDFKLFCFTIFFEERKSLILNSSNFIFTKKKVNDVTISYTKTFAKSWINPEKGGVKPKLFLGSRENQTYSVLFSNLSDGWQTACHVLSKYTSCKFIMVRLSGNTKNPVFTYVIGNNGNPERVVQLLKEGKWMFYQDGNPCAYERLAFYDEKIKSKRLTNELITDYLSVEGVDIKDIYEHEWEGIVLKYNSWK